MSLGKLFLRRKSLSRTQTTLAPKGDSDSDISMNGVSSLDKPPKWVGIVAFKLFDGQCFFVVLNMKQQVYFQTREIPILGFSPLLFYIEDMDGCDPSCSPNFDQDGPSPSIG